MFTNVMSATPFRRGRRAASGGPSKAVLGLVSGAVLAASLVAAPSAQAKAPDGPTPLAAADQAYRSLSVPGQVRRLAPGATSTLRGVVQASATANLPADGTFVLDGAGHVYRVTGRSLTYVSSWRVFGGAKQVVGLTSRMISQLRDYPADGTFVRTVQDGQIYRFVGGAPIAVTTWAAFGKPQRYLDIDANAVSGASRCEWDEDTLHWCFVLQVPDSVTGSTNSQGYFVLDFRSNVFVRAAQTGAIYQIVAGAPVYVSSWSYFGGAKRYTVVDAVAIERAGQAGKFAHLESFPEDQAFVRDITSGATYVFAGGAPIYVNTPALLKDDTEQTAYIPGYVDGNALTRAGEPGFWSHVRATPIDGVYLYTEASNVYVTQDGAPTATDTTLDEVVQLRDTGSAHVARIAQAAVDNAGEAGYWSHLSAPNP